jgi:hypothetical protein
MSFNPRDPLKGSNSVDGADSTGKEPFLSARTASSNGRLQNGETWVALCAQAAVEQDPKRLLELVSEINRLLDARKKRLATEADGSSENNSNNNSNK